ncbi:MAG: efflux RND transporter periplasmic adaptor subunit [Planctomycetia bacterium]|nr:efflux RND transporter periplasmic adaptor subunit [Planctomycetia bacterium]
MTSARWALGLGIALLATAVAWGLLLGPRGFAFADAPPVSRAPSVVVRGVVVKTIRRTVRLPADVLAFVEGRSAPQLTGRIVRVSVDVGARVSAGDELAEIEAPELDAARATATIRIAAAEAVQRARSAAKSAGDAAVNEGHAQVTQAEAEVARRSAERDGAAAEAVIRAAGRARLEAALAASRNLVSVDQVDEARVRDAAAAAQAAVTSRWVVEAEAAVAAARARVAALVARTVSLAADERSAAADVEVARALGRELEARRALRFVRAPCSGTVVARAVEVGDLVKEGGVPLFHVADQSRVRVRFQVAEADAAACEEGRVVEFVVDALPGAKFSATVTRTADVLDLRSRSMFAEADVDNPARRLRHGQFGRVTLSLEEHRDALVVPAEAVTTVKRKSSVLLVVDGRVVKRAIAIGADDGKEIIVTDGVKAGDQVIIRGGSSVAVGESVVAVEEPVR